MHKKQLDIELMRIVACFFVIFNHTENKGFFLFSSYDSHSIQFWLYMFISIFCKFSVPLFFCISGALLLCKESEPIGRLWKHKILKMFLILLIWSLLYYLSEVHLGWQEFSLKTFSVRFYDSNWNDALWYLYAYIPMLMTLPLLQSFAKSLTKQQFIYMFILIFVFLSLLPTVQYILWQDRHNLNKHFRIAWLCSDIILYPLLGYFLQTKLHGFWNKKRIVTLWIVNISFILLSCWLTYYKATITGVLDAANSQSFHSTFTAINCTAIFVTIKFIFEKCSIPLLMERIILSLGGCTFGIYLVHIFFINRIEAITNLWDVFRIQLHLNYMLAAFLYCGIVFILGYITTLILKRIPIIQKIVS